jgi:cytochrome c oxidase subunit 2
MNELLRRLLFLPPQYSSFARELDYLHYSVISVTMLGALVVAGSAAYFVVRYRRRSEGPIEAERRSASASKEPAGLPLRVELAVVIGLLVLFVSWWALGFRQFVMLQTPPPDALPIYASGKQWMWTFVYPNGAATNGVLLLPAGRPDKMILSSRDVIHSFFIPEFRVKKDVLPGQITTVWFEAPRPVAASIYCAEYCGTEHSLMRAQVQVLEPAEYAKRLSSARPMADAPTLASVGQRLAMEHGCLRCHTTDGTPHLGPSWAGLLGSTIPLRGGGSVVADEAYITESMMDPRVKLHAGYEAIMPSYQGLIDSPETGAIVEFIRSLPRMTGSRGSPLPPSDAPYVAFPGGVPGLATAGGPAR